MSEPVRDVALDDEALLARVEAARRVVLPALMALEAPTKNDADALIVATLDVVIGWLCGRVHETPSLKEVAVNLLLGAAVKVARLPDASTPKEIPS